MPKIFKDKSNKDKKVLMLIDSHALLHRGYHAMQNFFTRDGRPTGALYGFLKMIISANELAGPDYVVATYDLPKPTFRHLAYEGYKGTRQKSDDDLRIQILQSKDFCVALNIPISEMEGFEADDMLGTISKMYSDEYNIVIVSGDMDTLQLVNQNVKVCTLKKAAEVSVFGEKEVFDKYELTPKQIPDYKGLAGDASDNIPGVSGVGPKTAIKILKEYKTIENFYEQIKIDEKNNYENIHKVVKGKIFENIKNNEEDAIFSKTLATIILDAPIDKNIFNNFAYTFGENYNKESYEKLCDLYELRSLKNIFKKEADKVVNKNENKSISGNLVGAGLPIDNIEYFNSGKIDTENEDKENSEIKLSEKEMNELQVMSSVIESERNNISLEDLKNIHNIDDEENNFKVIKDILEIKLKDQENTRSILDDKNNSGQIILKSSFEYYKKLEEPLFEILENMRKAGVLVDKEELEVQKVFVKNIILNLEKEIHILAGKEFLISSPKQLGEILYDHMGLGTKIKKTASGGRSTNAEMLESIKDEHQIIGKIINFREVSKVFNTYIEPLHNFILPDGRVHPRFLQAGAATGRFSCENPNMQNIPRNTEIGLAFRKVFVAKKGNVFISADYSQIDLRAAAILSGDKKLMDIFNNDIDIHAGVAAQVLGKKIEEVTDEERRKAKAINFGILYGMGVSALKDAMHTDRKTAQDFYDNFKNTFHELISYLDLVKLEATKNGHTSTLFGRRRQIPLLKSKLPFMRSQGERIAINAPIQGTSSDIIKLGMINVSSRIFSVSYPLSGGEGAGGEAKEIKMLLQIHDELVFECEEKQAEKYSKIIKETMENVLDEYDIKNRVPLKVNIAVGKSLFEL